MLVVAKSYQPKREGIKVVEIVKKSETTTPWCAKPLFKLTMVPLVPAPNSRLPHEIRIYRRNEENEEDGGYRAVESPGPRDGATVFVYSCLSK